MRALLLFILLFVCAELKANSWKPLYPYIQKTENNKVQCRAVPYGPHDGPGVIGETFVSYKGKPLYSIDKYFRNPFFTYNNGQYLVEFELYPYLPQRRQTRAWQSVPATIEPFKYAGKVIRIFKDGKIFNEISFDQLKIDTAKLSRNERRNWFGWGYRTKADETDNLDIKMSQYPVYITSDTLSLITVDNQLINIKITTGEILWNKDARNILSANPNWVVTDVERKRKKVRYPDKFLLPKLSNGKTLADALAQYFNMKISEHHKDKHRASIQIYLHTLLINKQGKCEIAYISPTKRSDLSQDFSYNYDKMLEDKIEKWLKEQVFQTKTLPRGFLKFKYTDFVYLE